MAVVVAGVIALTLAYITIMPFFRGPRGWASRTVSGATAVIERIASRQTKHIAAALDRSSADAEVLSQAVALARAQNARLTLLHVADSAQTQIYGSEAYGEHEQSDELYLDEIATELRGTGLPVEIMLLHGVPAQQLISFGESHGVDLLVMGSHGHRAISDIILGETVAPVRHGTQIPVLVVRQTG
jgi:manganese transport protein